jgi:hypothetical protein
VADYEQTLLIVKGESNLNCCFCEAISEGDKEIKLPQHNLPNYGYKTRPT